MKDASGVNRQLKGRRELQKLLAGGELVVGSKNLDRTKPECAVDEESLGAVETDLEPLEL